MHESGEAMDGLALRFYSAPRYRFAIRFPTRSQALEDWSADLGFEAKPTQDARYADAILARIENPSALDALATASAVELLRQLAPQSRLKLAQRLRGDVRQVTGRRRLDVILDELRSIGLFLETASKDLTGLAGAVRQSTKDVLAALEPLVGAGFVVRGRVVTCPECNVTEFRALDELAEEIRCRACPTTFLLPVADKGLAEPSTHYRLDGLMARVMDQDVLPVLLAVRQLRRLFNTPHGLTSWHGVEFTSGREAVDIDVLAYNGDQLFVCECKDNGGGLHDRQLRRVLEFANKCDARPVLACLRGTFARKQQDLIAGRNGIILHPTDLIEA